MFYSLAFWRGFFIIYAYLPIQFGRVCFLYLSRCLYDAAYVSREINVSRYFLEKKYALGQ